MTIFTSVKKEDFQKLGDFCKLQPKTIYEEFRCEKEGVTLILYAPGKLLLQGKKDAVKHIADFLEKKGIGQREKLHPFRKEEGWVIGSDESLKGDTFGGVTVAAVKADDKLRKELMEWGVADSKLLEDKDILPLAEIIRKKIPCTVKSVFPEEYNRAAKMTELLNRLHRECAYALAPGTHIVDKYPGCTAGTIQEEHAESKYVEVAAASILARAAALQQINALSREAGFPLPLGSTHVALALQELQERQLDPRRFVKMHFSNVQKAFTS